MTKGITYSTEVDWLWSFRAPYLHGSLPKYISSFIFIILVLLLFCFVLFFGEKSLFLLFYFIYLFFCFVFLGYYFFKRTSSFLPQSPKLYELPEPSYLDLSLSLILWLQSVRDRCFPSIDVLHQHIIISESSYILWLKQLVLLEKWL